MELIECTCKRCGVALTTGKTALLAEYEELKKQYGMICRQCMSPEEQRILIKKMFYGLEKSKLEAK